DIRRLTHRTIHNVTGDYQGFHLNKAVARIRELTNALERMEKQTPEAQTVFLEGLNVALKLINPVIPHITEEAALLLGAKTPLVESAWPEADKTLLVEDV